MQEKNKVIFPEPVSHITIRTLEKTEKDYIEIARCFNSFKDSDSWPDGFGGSFIFTKEWAENEYSSEDLSSHFIAEVGEKSDSKIVGVCYCNRSSSLKDAWYVALLGVDPAFQGQKIGKSLLLKATEFALSQKARFISLHTWGGNLKAMPLYKRQGYKWRPNTMVYMENYIPQILAFPLFKPIFKKLSWYDTFKPKIVQEQDREFIGEMKTYEYRFKDEKANFELTTWVDRTVGFINGFHLKNGEENIEIRALTPKSEAFIGIEDFPIMLEISNNSEEEKEIEVSVKSSSSIKLKENVTNKVLKLHPKKKVELLVEGSFLPETRDFDDKRFSQSLVDHFISFSLVYKGTPFSLKVGKIPKIPIKLETFPFSFAVKHGTLTQIPLQIRNYTEKDQSLKLDIADGKYIQFSSHSSTLNVTQYDTSIMLEAKIRDTHSTVDYIPIKVFSTDVNKEIKEFLLPILIFNENKALYYKIDQFNAIENKYVRVKFDETVLGRNYLTIEDKKRKLRINGNSIVLGLPFDSEGSEFYTTELVHKIKETEQGIQLISTGVSEQKKGITVKRKLFVPHDSSCLSISYELENTSKSDVESLGIQNVYYWWTSSYPLKRKILPLKEGIYYNNFPEISLELGKEPKKLKEGWTACEYEKGVIGFLFDLENIDKVNLDRDFPQVEYTLDFLEAGQKHSFPPIYFYFTDKWKDVKEQWMEIYERKYKEYEHNEPLPMRKFGLSLTNNSRIVDSLFVDKRSSSITCSLDAFFPTELLGKFSFKNNLFTADEIELRGNKISRFSKKLSLPNQSDQEVVYEELIYDTGSYITTKKLSLCIYDRTASIRKELIEKEQKKPYYTVSNDLLTFKASHEFSGIAFHLSYKNDRNILKTFWPETPSFLWDNRFFGGIIPEIAEYGSWGNYDYYDLKFELLDDVKKGKFEGIGFRSEIINYSPYLKGLQVTNYYLTLPKAPVLYIEQKITNHSGAFRYFKPTISVNIDPSKTVEDKYYLHVNDSYLTFRTQDYESETWTRKSRNSKWIAYKHKNMPYYLGFIANSNESEYSVTPYIPNLSLSMLFADSPIGKIKPKEETTYSAMIVFADKLEKIPPFINSNIDELLES